MLADSGFFAYVTRRAGVAAVIDGVQDPRNTVGYSEFLRHRVIKRVQLRGQVVDPVDGFC